MNASRFQESSALPPSLPRPPPPSRAQLKRETRGQGGKALRCKTRFANISDYVAKFCRGLLVETGFLNENPISFSPSLPPRIL